MLFVAIGWDAPDSREKRPAARAAHLEHWRGWVESGRVVLAGPMTDFAGSLFLLRAGAIEEVRAQIEADPYVAAGVFQRVEVHPFRKTLPTPEDL